MAEFEILPISENDLGYVSKIMQMRWDVDSEWAGHEAKKFIAQDENAAGFCVHCAGETIGVGLFDRENPDVSGKYGPWLLLLWIEPKYRGNCIGIELTRKRMEHARRFGYKKVYLDTTDAEPYHRKLGWQKVDTIDYEGNPDTIMNYDLSEEFPKK